MNEVQLDYLLSRFDLDSEVNWPALLSPGEKQRISLARLLYRNPKFAILDESTSALSIDIEDRIYNLLKRKNITCISVGHRPTLIQYHDYILKLDGKGGWIFGKKETFRNIVN